MAKIDQNTKDAIRKLYIHEPDYTPSSIAAAFNVSPNTVLTWKKEDQDTVRDWDKGRELNHHFNSSSYITLSQQLSFVQFQMNKIMETYKETPIDSKSADVMIKLRKILKEMRSSDELLNTFDILKKFALFLHKIDESSLAEELSNYIELFIQDRLKEFSK